MKKSFAENCIRYISTATALILALAMLCCANFSAGAKNLGSNLTITDTTLLLKDINTTTNTTPAKTKDLLASGAGVEILSIGVSITYSGTEKIYFNKNALPDDWVYSYYYAYFYNSSNNSNRWSELATHVKDVNGESIYSVTVPNGTWTHIILVNKEYNNTEWDNGKRKQTGNLELLSGQNYIKVFGSGLNTATWSTYSSATTYIVTFNYKGHGTNTDETVDSNTQINAPTEPTETGYTFGGWYTDESLTTKAAFPYTVTSDVTFYAKWTENASSTVSADIISVLKDEKIMFYIGNSWGSTTMYHRTSSGSSTDNGISTSSTVEINKVNCNYGVVCDTPKKYYISNSNWDGLQLSATAEAGKFYILNTSPSLGGSNNNIYVSPVSGSASGSATTTVTDTTVSTTFTISASGIGLNYDLVYYIKSGDTYYKIATTQSGANSYIASADDGDYTLYTCLTDGNITVLKDTDTFTKSSVVKYDVNVHYNGKGGTDYTSKIEENTDFAVPTSTSVEGYTLEGWYTTSTFDTGTKVTFPLTITGKTDLYAKWEQNAFKHKYVFLDTTKKDWILSGGCKVYISFDDGNSYTKMNELFTNDSGYDTTNKSSKLLFAKVPDNTTKFIFRRQNTSGTYNETPYLYSNFKNNNLLTLQDDINAGNNNIDGTWSTVDYTPVPINFTVGGNGKVYLVNTNEVDMPVTSGTIYADKAANSLKIKATPDAENGYELNTLKVNGFDKAGEISDKSAGGIVNVGTLNDENTGNTVEVTFKASKSPKIKVPTVPNSTIKLTYTDPEDVSQTGTEFETEYTIKYNSTFTLEITPDSGYYVESLGENLTTTETLPKAGIITATQTGTGVKDELLSLSYVIKANPKVTIKVPANGTVDFTYTNDNGVSTTANATGTYSVYYGSDISYKVNPKDGYYVAKITGVTTQSPTPPVAEAVTGSVSNITANVEDTITCTLNPNPTVKVICCDTDGTELGAEKVTLKFGTTDIISSEGKKVTYNSDTANTFTATAVSEDEYHFSGFYTKRPTVSSPVSDDNKITTTEISTDDYKTSAAENVLTVKNVKNDVTFYAVFSQLYQVEFIFSNLENFTINGSDKIGVNPIVSGSCVYVAKEAILSLKATVGDDYQLKNSSWTCTDKKGVFTFNNDSAEDVTYKVAGNSTITITPQIATYKGEGKWGSKTLRIDTSSVGKQADNYEPWFAVAFKTSTTDTDNYFIRCSKVSDDLYECVIPDGYTHFDVYRMATGATAFTTEVETSGDKLDSTIAWNKTHQVDADNKVVPVEIGSNTSYKLSYNGTVGQMSIATK